MRTRYLSIFMGSTLLSAPAFAAKPAVKPAAAAAASDKAIVSIEVQPAALTFLNRRDTRKVLVLGRTRDGYLQDLTPAAKLQPVGGVVQLQKDGYLAPAKAGKGVVKVMAGGKSVRLPVSVRSMAAPPVSYVREVQPILAKAGCNAGTCHGAASGRNGFKLSLRGYDPDFDYHALVDDVAGRRVNLAEPDESLMLQKATQVVPHRGGLVFEKGSPFYRTIRQWIAEGAKSDVGSAGRVASVEVLPRKPSMPRPGMKQSLVVLAKYPDGATRDVTREARFTSSVPEIGEISDDGTLKSVRRGETVVLVAYEGQFATDEFTILGDRTGWKWSSAPEFNYVDRLVDAKLKRVKALPSPLCTDADFVRRAYLDLTGLLPPAEEARAFLQDPTPSAEKRERLIDRLLLSPEFDDHWTYKFADLLQVNGKYIKEKGVQAFRGWIHEAIATNKPYDQFVREILTASGSSYENPAANYFRIARDTSTATENITQLFLGVRFSCNKCHDHPFERWTQNQYYELGAFFAQVGFKPGSPGDEYVYDRNTGDLSNPRTGKMMTPTFPVSFAGAKTRAATRREALADWLISPKNPFFAKSMANRVWSYFMGRGIIDPVDDIRASNPPGNPELLDALTDEFVKSGFNLRQLMKTITMSRVYQSSIGTNRWNEDDKINFSHQVARRLTAEQLLDAITAATGSVQRYPGVPYGTRAQQLADTRVAGGGFLDLFGRPPRESPCECERTSEVSLAQALNLMNGETISQAIADPKGRVEKLIAENRDDGKVVEDLYLAAFTRLPSAKERDLALKHFKEAKDRKEAAQDLLWALINSPAFLFNR